MIRNIVEGTKISSTFIDRSFSAYKSPNEMRKRKNKNADEKALLPQEFKPSPYSVIVGRGKHIRATTGNRRLRVLASSHLQEYAHAVDNKAAKTQIVNLVVSLVKDACPSGAFVRRSNGRWWEVSETVAREKVGYVFRDLLHDRYESSSKSKVAKRRREKDETQENLICSVSPATLPIDVSHKKELEPWPLSSNGTVFDEMSEFLIQATPTGHIHPTESDSSSSSGSTAYFYSKCMDTTLHGINGGDLAVLPANGSEEILLASTLLGLLNEQEAEKPLKQKQQPPACLRDSVVYGLLNAPLIECKFVENEKGDFL